MERRRVRGVERQPTELLDELPALVALERMPVPALAVGADGAILFANRAFAEMLGSTIDTIKSRNFWQIFPTLPTDGSAVSVARDHADVIVQLRHTDESIICARMSKSALLRGGDQVALVTFQDVTEKLWIEES